MKTKKIISNLAVVVPTSFNLLNRNIEIKDHPFSFPLQLQDAINLRKEKPHRVRIAKG